MAITYPLAFPTSRYPASVQIRARSVVGVSESPFSLSQQVQRHPGQAWGASITLPPMEQTVAEQWVAWLLSLNGREGTFLMGDPVQLTHRGVGGGTPLVNGGSQTGNTLAIDGCPTSTTGWLLAGDMIQLGSGSSTRLHKVLTQADTDGSGEVTLDIWPRLRESPANNAAVTIVAAKGLWRLASNVAAWDVRAALRYGIAFEAQEAL